MPDAIFADPRLACLYDTFDGDRADLAAYLRIADELGVRDVLDLGCGTGALALLLASSGRGVTAVDPARASLEVAQRKAGADRIRWVHGDATSLPNLQVDAALMTSNVAQVFLSQAEWSAMLRGVRKALRVGGHLVFETRRPEWRAWDDWATAPGPVVREVVGIGVVEQRIEVTAVELPFVSFRHSYSFPDGAVLTSCSTLRFHSREEIDSSLSDAGFQLSDVREAIDRPGREYVFIARRLE